MLPEKLGGCSASFLKPTAYFRPKFKIFSTLVETQPKIRCSASDLRDPEECVERVPGARDKPLDTYTVGALS